MSMISNQKNLETFSDWATDCSEAVDKLLDLTAPFLLDKPIIDPKHQFVLRHLAVTCNRATQSTLVVITSGFIWEAEILLRCVVEGSFKYAFLCHGDESALSKKLDEYWEQLFEISKIKDHQRVSDMLQHVENPDSLEWKPLRDLQLSSEELSQLQQNFPRIRRKQIEHGWAFNEIIGELSKADPTNFQGFTGFAYNYGLSSHLIHQDSSAVRLIWDRNVREEERKRPLELAHAARIISDLISMASFRAIMTYKLHQQDTAPVISLYNSYNKLFEDIQNSYNSWLKAEYGDQ